MDFETTWIIIISLFTVALAVLLFYVRYQLIALRGTVNELSEKLKASSAALDLQVSEAKNHSMQVAAALASVSGTSTTNHLHAQQYSEIMAKMKTVEAKIAALESNFATYTATQRTLENSVAPVVVESAAKVARSPTALIDTKLAASMTSTLATPRSPVRLPPSGYGRDTLSFTFPPKMFVYQQVRVADGWQMTVKKLIHLVSIAGDGGATTGEVCFIFADVDVARRADWDQVLAESCRNRTGVAGVTCIPSSTVALLEVKLASAEQADALGAAAGDTQNLVVIFHRRSPVMEGSRTARRVNASWDSASVSQNNSAAAVSDALLDRRAFLRAAAITRGTLERPFVVFIPGSAVVEEWITFATQSLGDRAHVAENALRASDLHLLDL